MKGNYKVCVNMDKELTFSKMAALLKASGLMEFWKGGGIKNLNQILKLLALSFRVSPMEKLKCFKMENSYLMAKLLEVKDMDMVFIILMNLYMKANFFKI